MNKKKKTKNIFAVVLTTLALITIVVVIIAKTKKVKITEVLPLQNTERFCYVLESKNDPISGFDFAFVNLEVSGDKAKATMKLALPNIPAIEGVLQGSYDSTLQRLDGTYTGNIQGNTFNESRVAQITADGFVFAQDLAELEILLLSQDISYLVPSISCERFDQRITQYSS